MQKLLNDLKKTFPKLKFHGSDRFYWSPQTKEIFYNKKGKGKVDKWSLLHETGHALLDHLDYDSDFMLVKLEVEAWEKAKTIAKEFKISIDPNHIQDCLDSYRDWLYRRSICPKCSTKSLQESDARHYRCFNCHMRWRVTDSRFVRTYRISDGGAANQPVFV
jgi:hypothetical protein